MRAHVLNSDGKIINTIVVDSLDFLPNLVNAEIGGTIGDIYIGGTIMVAPIDIAAHNAPILEALEVIDLKSIRPLREGDAARVMALEQQAAALRLQLLK